MTKRTEIKSNALRPIRCLRLTRIFNGDMSSGGRFYHAFWLCLSEAERGRININGEPTCEYDFPCCHIRLVYLGLGHEDPWNGPTSDLYGFAGNSPVARSVIKRSVQILLNAKTPEQAEEVIFHLLPGCNNERRRAVARHIIQQLKLKFKPIKELWGQGVGLALQFVDSEIIRICLGKLLDRGIVGLPVHDSIIVAERHRDILISIMETTFVNEGAKLAIKRLRYLRQRGQKGLALTVEKEEPKKDCRRTSKTILDTRQLAVDAVRLNDPGLIDREVCRWNRVARRKAQRWNDGAIPNIINPDKTKCWQVDGVGRSKWYENNSGGIARQACSAHYAKVQKMNDVLEEAKVDLIDAIHLRVELCKKRHLLVDDLFSKLCPIILGQAYTDIRKKHS